ncbi:hypothetical protein MYSTI_02262 [Myxococcus stipitatus DSM 14675]|uniref:DUF2934 domain-containing protein n=1 Tax=Myxococcus stipitatus (strain DSM 14675 / JCM 12634 / Mx s8) TaxID=1278073 RepID=L7UAV1_MYXSD|nr:DUF2934 domain-containing protein [Myxococcus stipitatus]AGC43584.1 hypothetical protein MYSTI_02262 [Myxococcus stipitatus DSM 14675]
MARSSGSHSHPRAAPQSSEQAPEPHGSRNVITHEQISRRAYEIFMARGGLHGSHEQDWAQAERELKLGRQ